MITCSLHPGKGFLGHHLLQGKCASRAPSLPRGFEMCPGMGEQKAAAVQNPKLWGWKSGDSKTIMRN